MILLALVATVTSQSKLQTCKLGGVFFFIGVQTKLLHINSIPNSGLLILSLSLIFGTNRTHFEISSGCF